MLDCVHDLVAARGKKGARKKNMFIVGLTASDNMSIYRVKSKIAAFLFTCANMHNRFCR